MKLITKEIEKKLEQSDIMDSPINAEIILKLFGGSAATWWITSGERDDSGEWMFYGVTDLGMGYREMGYISFAELKEIKFPPFGLGIERDMHFSSGQVFDIDLQIGSKV